MMNYLKLFVILLGITLFSGILTAQTSEDSLMKKNNKSIFTSIGGYGNIVYRQDFRAKDASVNVDRIVLFAGHKFNDKISFFSELAIEDAKVTGGENGGEVALEKAFLKFDINPTNYIVAGLFIPRIGILNEDHLPNTFYGNEKTQVETYIIPTTWREIGIGYYGKLNRIPLNYSLGFVNGLNAKGFTHDYGIRDGRWEGKDASANCLALTGSIQYSFKKLKLQISGYYGGSNSRSGTITDTIKLKRGVFALPVGLLEGDVQYENKGIRIRALGSVVNIKDAYKINYAYKNSIAKTLYGMYAEIGYNVFETMDRFKGQQLIPFFRYERMDMNQQAPDNGYRDRNLDREHLIAGVNYLPVKNVVIKTDFRYLHTTNEAAAHFTYFTLGVGYSF